MKTKLILLFLLVFVSCKKEPAIEIDQEFRGTWRHNYGENWYDEISFQSNSRGDIEHYQDGMTSGTFKFKWLIKNNRLYHGWLEGKKDALDIDHYPTIANSTIVSEHNTVFPGNGYMILEGAYYIKI